MAIVGEVWNSKTQDIECANIIIYVLYEYTV